MPPPCKRPSASQKRPATAGCSDRPHKKPAVARLEADWPRPFKVVSLPRLSGLKLKKDTPLDVRLFKKFLVSGTSADKPLFLRKHMMEVHGAVVKALGSSRLVSLVGCPGIGKTWCGHLVAYSLQEREISVLHLTVRGSGVVAIQGQRRRDFLLQNFEINFFNHLVEESSCRVCILDIGDVAAEVVSQLCRSMRTILDYKPAVNFMCLVSGHAQEVVIGKQRIFSTATFVMWSWTEEEVTKMMKSRAEEKIFDFSVCGGSVRLIDKPADDKQDIVDAVSGMTSEQVSKFLGGDQPTSDAGVKQFTRLMAFYGLPNKSFRDGISAAAFLPRSRAVMLTLRTKALSAPKETWVRIYNHLKVPNPGAAGTAFERLVHLFWRDRITSKVKLQLTVSEKGHSPCRLEVDCKDLECCDNVDIQSTTSHGYFTPKSVSNPVFDSMLRLEAKVFFIQISIAQHHTVSQSPPSWASPNLALWDYPQGGKACQWKGDDKGWKLHKIHCDGFDEFLQSVSV